MPETLHTEEYYLSIAEKHPLFEPVITGEDSLVHWLDRIAEDVCNKPQDETLVRLEVMCELYNSEVPSAEKIPHESLSTFFGSLVGYTLAGVYVPTFAGIAAMTFIPPPFGEVLGAYLIGLGMPFACVLTPLVGTAKRWERLRERRKRALQPLYATAESLDADISRCFIMEDFGGCRSRFEATYRSLTEEERSAIDSRLRVMLSAGAFDMGEADLDRYLSGLLAGSGPDG